MYDVTTLGDMKLDLFLELDNDTDVTCHLDTEQCEMRLPYGTKIAAHGGHVMVAGSAPNIAIGLRRLGAASDLISTIGTDSVAQLTKETLRKEGLALDHLTVDPSASSPLSVILNLDGESTVITAHQAQTYHLPDPLQTRLLFIGELGPGYKQLFRELTKKAKEGLHIGLNPGALQIKEQSKELQALLEHTQLLVVNTDEAQRLTGSPSTEPRALLTALAAMGPTCCIVTRGAEGAWALEQQQFYDVPAFPGTRVEATGAGDAFITGVLAGRVHQRPFEEALAWGSINAASVIQHVGAHAGLLTRSALQQQLHDHPTYQVTRHVC